MINNKVVIIKNMVCPRCVDTVRDILTNSQILYNSIELGRVQLVNNINAEKEQFLAEKLSEKGFELLNDKETKLINQIKTFIIEKVHYGKHKSNQNISAELSKLTDKEYSAISKTFSKVEGLTIEHYLMYQKIEKVKELLSYDELNLTEIALELEYSSTAHLSNQFKKVTGMTPSAFKKLTDKPRSSIDDIK